MPIKIQVSNHKPAVLEPFYKSPLKNPLDYEGIIKQIVCDPCREPLVQGAPCTLKNGAADISDDEIIVNAAKCNDENWDVGAEEFMCQLMSQCLSNYNPQTVLSFREVFSIQAAATAGVQNFPDPSPNVIYTSAEVIQAAGQFINGKIDYNQLFATFAYRLRAEILGFYFLNEIEFQNYLTYLDNFVQMLGNNLSGDCMKLITEFKKSTLSGLTESFRLRDTSQDNLDPYSFARVLTMSLIGYVKTSGISGIFPMNFDELIVPKNLVLFNIEKFSHATPRAVDIEFDDIIKGINISNKIPMISNKRLNKLTAAPRAMRKNAAAVQAAAQQTNTMAARAKLTIYRKRLPTANEYLVLLTKILKKMRTNRVTMNVYKYSKPSFMKPNRRDPDDWNKQGVITSTKYSPDIHIYLDCSGSISEEDYATAVKMCIRLARKLDVNLYVNSFSDVLSQTVKLDCKGKSVNTVYGKFQKIPKVTGGTNFVPIWDFINASKKRQDELSLIVSDMEWSAPGRFIKHPENLYYVPIKTSWSSSLSELHHWCDYFVKSCMHNEPNIRRRILL